MTKMTFDRIESPSCTVQSREIRPESQARVVWSERSRAEGRLRDQLKLRRRPFPHPSSLASRDNGNHALVLSTFFGRIIRTKNIREIGQKGSRRFEDMCDLGLGSDECDQGYGSEGATP